MKKIIALTALLMTVITVPLGAFAHQHEMSKAAHEINIPAVLKGPDQHGKERTLENISGEKGAVVIFSRSLDWCPYCQRQAIELKKKSSQFNKIGYKVAIITYDPPHKTKSFSDKKDLRFPVIYDEGSKIITDFGLLNTKHKAGSKFYGVPHPAIFVIAKDGSIIKEYQEDGYKNRPDLDKILIDLQQ